MSGEPPTKTVEAEIVEPDSARLTAWYERRDRSSRGDHPNVSVWWPGDPPTARLQTRGHGCNMPDTLPEGPLVAYFKIGGVEFGGYLDDMEWLLDAAREAVALVRWQAENMSRKSEVAL